MDKSKVGSRQSAPSALSLGLCLLLLSFGVMANDGSLDTTFGIGGRQIVTFEPDGSFQGRAAVAVHPDGSLLLAASADKSSLVGIGLARVNADGEIDENFGHPWHRPSANPAYEQYVVRDAALQADGKLIVTGQVLSNTNTSFGFTCRFLPHGDLDTSFATQNNTFAPGCRLIPRPNSFLSAIAVQRNGRIALAGYEQGDVYRGLVVRLDSQGNFDLSFNGNGINALQVESSLVNLRDIAEAPNGDLIAVGSGTVNNNASWLIARLRGNNGELDDTFFGGGIRQIDVDVVPGGNDYAAAVSVLPGGQIVVGGAAAGNGSSACPAIARLLPNGHNDNYLDGDGLYVALQCLSSLVINDMVVQSDGRIVLAGGPIDFFAIRFEPQGGNDITFGFVNGFIMFNFATLIGVGANEAHRLVFDGGRPILVGFAKQSNIAVARLNNDLIYADDLE